MDYTRHTYKAYRITYKQSQSIIDVSLYSCNLTLTYSWLSASFVYLLIIKIPVVPPITNTHTHTYTHSHISFPNENLNTHFIHLIYYTCTLHGALRNDRLTENGSACSQVMELPHMLLRVPSRSDSGTMNIIKTRFMIAMPVARETTLNMPVLGYSSSINVPRAGLITKLAANMADTCKHKPTII